METNNIQTTKKRKRIDSHYKEKTDKKRKKKDKNRRKIGIKRKKNR
jgi:hypothetical protein